MQTRRVTLFTQEGEQYIKDVLEQLDQKEYQVILLSNGIRVQPLILNGEGNAAALKVGLQNIYIKPQEVPEVIKRLEKND